MPTPTRTPVAHDGPSLRIAQAGSYDQRPQLTLDRPDHDSRNVDILAAKARFERQQSIVAQLVKRVGDTQFLTPVSGIVARRLVNEHTTVKPGAKVAQIISMATILVTIELPAARYAEFEKKPRVSVASGLDHVPAMQQRQTEWYRRMDNLSRAIAPPQKNRANFGNLLITSHLPWSDQISTTIYLRSLKTRK